MILRNPLVLSILSLCIAISAVASWYSYHLLPGTSVQGHKLGNQTRSQAERTLASIALPQSLDVHAGTAVVPVPLNTLGLSINIADTYATLRAAQLSSVLRSDKRALLLPRYSVDEAIARQKLIAVLTPLRTEPINAELQFNSLLVTVKDSQSGEEFSVDEAVQQLHQAIKSSSPAITLGSHPLAPSVTTAQLQASKRELEGILSTNVTLVDGADTYPISSSRISQMLSYNSNTQSVALDPAAVSTFIKKIAGYVDVSAQDETHATLDGRELSVVAGVTGKHLDQKAATTTLASTLQHAQSVSITLPMQPDAFRVVYAKKSSPYGSTYIEASISDQHLWVHQNGTVVYQTAITTGATNSGDATPTGVYHIYAKQSDLTLRGPTWDDHVSYWMPFYGAYGLHDATWRARFGTQDYANVGSHGCLNLPLQAAGWIYDWSTVGTTVWITA